MKIHRRLHHRLKFSPVYVPVFQSKEADLQAIEQVLLDPALTSVKFREWKEANSPLVQEICVKADQQVALDNAQAAASVIAAPVVETSI